MRELRGKTAFVTGAASGIGLGICRALARAGVNVALADIEQQPLDTAVAEIAALGVRAFGVRLDVSDEAAVQRAAAEVEATFDALHILSNNAGVTSPARRCISGDEAGKRVRQAIVDNEFFVFTHPQTRAWIEDRHRRLMAGFDANDRYLAGQSGAGQTGKNPD